MKMYLVLVILAIYLDVLHFKHMIEGQQFFIYTDNKSVIFALCQKLKKA